MSILDEILSKAKLLKDARDEVWFQKFQDWSKERDDGPHFAREFKAGYLAANETAFLVAAVEHLCERVKLAEDAILQICALHNNESNVDTCCDMADTACAALNAATDTEAQFEKQWGTE